MSFLWHQITDLNHQLYVSVLIGVMAFECLVAIWAGMSTAHWLWRALAVWAAVMLMIPIRAWELIWVFALSALLIAGTVQAGRWAAWRLGSQASASGQLIAPRYRYSLRDLLLCVLLVCLWLPGLVAAARNATSANWPGRLVASAWLAAIAIFSARIAFGPRRGRAIALLLVALPLGAAAMFSTVSRMYLWIATATTGSYTQELTGLVVVELQLVIVLIVVMALARASRSPALAARRRAISAIALATLATIATAWLGWAYVQLLQRPPAVARFELPGNHYDRILELARRMRAINPGEASIASFRSVSPQSTAALELEALYDELFPLLAAENAVPYDPAHDSTDEYIQVTLSSAQLLRGLCRSLKAESESALANGDPDLAADYAIACLELGQMLSRGGVAIHALVGRALDGVGTAQLAKLRAQLSPSHQLRTIASLARHHNAHEEIAVLHARELDYGDRVLGVSARLENTFLKLSRRKAPWEEALGEATRRQGSLNAMLQADLAIRLFELDHDRLPQGLAELVPAYLPAIPLDPYSGKSLCEKLLNDGLTVYSVGRDGIDNGGTFGNSQTYWSSTSGYDLDVDTLMRP